MPGPSRRPILKKQLKKPVGAKKKAAQKKTFTRPKAKSY